MNSNQGAIPKQSKLIVKTALNNKSLTEKCQLMDMMETRKLFQETDIALHYSDTLLNIFDFIEAVQFRIDTMMLNKFWQCVAENSSVQVDGTVLEWRTIVITGYNKRHFIELLEAHQIEEKDNKASFIKLFEDVRV